MKRKPKLIVAIHGILTREISSAWQEQFQRFVVVHTPGVDVELREYWAAPLPIFNVCLKNTWQANSLASILEPYFRDHLDVSFLCHSNGADIGLKTIRELAARGKRTRAFVSIAGAIQADVTRNHVAELIRTGHLEKAVSYSSASDQVLKPDIIWPYGHLGRTGFMFGDRPYLDGDIEGLDGMQIRTRWFKGYDHGTYFAAQHRATVFKHAVEDCCFL